MTIPTCFIAAHHAALLVFGFPVGQLQVISAGVAVALVVSVTYRVVSRLRGKRYN